MKRRWYDGHTLILNSLSMNNPDISLIFVNFQSVYELSLAFQRLFSLELDRSIYEVIVVNNDPSEAVALEALAQKLGFLLVSLPVNVGFGAAVNIGAKQARGTLLGLLNPDTLWQKLMLSEIVDYFQVQKKECLVGMTLLDEHQAIERLSHGAAPRMSHLIRSNLFPFTVRHSHLSIDWVSGGGLFLRKILFERLGGFDERFFLYFEDVDFCLRALARGASITVQPQFTLLHRGGKSFSSRQAQKAHFYQSQKEYYAKHRPAWENIVLRYLHFILHDA